MRFFNKYENALPISEQIERLKVVGFNVANGRGRSRCQQCRQMHDAPTVFVPDWTDYQTAWTEIDRRIHDFNGDSTGWCVSCAYKLLPTDEGWYQRRLDAYLEKQRIAAKKREEGLRTRGPRWASTWWSGQANVQWDEDTNLVTVTDAPNTAPIGTKYTFPYVADEWLGIDEHSFAEIKTLPSFQHAKVETYEKYASLIEFGVGYSDSSLFEIDRIRRAEWERQQKLKSAGPYIQYIAICEGTFPARQR